MDRYLQLEKFSLGVGDRFARQAEAQLQSCVRALEAGVPVIPVWNKSNREHLTIGSEPAATRRAAEAAVRARQWKLPYHVDADHIRLDTVDRFLPYADFFTIDVAHCIGEAASEESITRFISHHPELSKPFQLAGRGEAFEPRNADVRAVCGRYLRAVEEASLIYRHICERKGKGNFIAEISMDETDHPQSPFELLVILAAIADAGVPIQTIAPKFSGRFNKGVDYAGEVDQFEAEFTGDLAVIALAVERYGLPPTLKLSVHSGSDKFSIYPAIHRALQKSGAGLHLKTAGTTWLEELIGLAEAGGSGLKIAREIYREALAHQEELCAPYAAVIDIRRENLPSAETVSQWSSEQFLAALRHDPDNPAYNRDMRQLLHVGYKMAAKMGQRYLDALEENRELVARNVTENLFVRHLRPLFLDTVPKAAARAKATVLVPG